MEDFRDEARLRTLWKIYGNNVGPIVERYDKRFRRIIRKYGYGLDQDELYSDLVSLRIPVYIDNWDCTKESSLIDWICYSIYLRILKRRYDDKHRVGKLKIVSFDVELCFKKPTVGIKMTEKELLEGLNKWEVYLLKNVVIDRYSIPAIASANGMSPGTIRSDYKKAISKCKRLLR